MKVVVITGSTRGIGYGMADAFLNEGCCVMVSGRTQEAVDQGVKALGEKYSVDRVHGFPCNVSIYAEMQKLWDASIEKFKKVDIWINNAGIGHKLIKSWELPPEQVEAVVDTNMLGVMYGSMVAVRSMLEQGFGSIYNMEGMGSDGRRHDGLTYYGCTKYGLHYYTESLVKELEEKPIVVGFLQPGMVVTDLIIERLEGPPEERERIKRIFNILADRVETVTPWLAKEILKNDKTGARISWLTRGKLIGRFLTAPFRKRDLFSG